LWGGLLAENITQAFCAALLRDAIRRADAEKVESLVAHVHDELIFETDTPITVAGHVQQVMEEVPAWAKGLPLKAEPVILNRYGNH
jgi:DNA polymerase